MVIIYEHDLGMVVLICGISTHITEAGELVQETRTRYRVGDITAWTIFFFQIFSSYVCIWFYIKIIKKLKRNIIKPWIQAGWCTPWMPALWSLWVIDKLDLHRKFHDSQIWMDQWKSNPIMIDYTQN